MNEILYFLICFCSTIIGSISGIGGGIIIKPLLDSISSMSISSISFLSTCTVFAMSIVSLGRSLKGDIRIEKGRGTTLAISAAIGGVLGKLIFEQVKVTVADNAAIGRIQNLLLLIQVVFILIYIQNKSRIRSLNVQSLPCCALMGLLLGMLSSFLGIGGGPVNIFVLSFFLGMDSKKAALHSIYIIFFSQLTSLCSTFFGRKVPEFSWLIMLLMVGGGISGAFLGRGIARRINNKTTDLLFSGLLLFVTLLCIRNFIRFS